MSFSLSQGILCCVNVRLKFDESNVIMLSSAVHAPPNIYDTSSFHSLVEVSFGAAYRTQLDKYRLCFESNII